MTQCKTPFHGEDHAGWSHASRRCFKDWERLDWKLWHKESFQRCEMKLTVLFLFAVFTAGAQSTTEHLPATDGGKIADALRSINGLVMPIQEADKQ
jgi:hypothetical protein